MTGKYRKKSGWIAKAGECEEPGGRGVDPRPRTVSKRVSYLKPEIKEIWVERDGPITTFLAEERL